MKAFGVVVAVAGLPTTALAHVGEPPAPHDLWQAWSWEPAVLLGLAVGAAAYARGLRILWRRIGTGRVVRRWQALAYAGGWLAGGVALVSPLDALGSALFSAHMLQHLLLILVAAPLLVLGAPLAPALWALPAAGRAALARAWRRAPAVRAAWAVLTLPLVALTLHTVAVWGWHAPPLYEAALAEESVHALEHASFLGTALLFWWLLAGPRGPRRLVHGAGVLYLFAAASASSGLGALITFAPAPWYPTHAARVGPWGLSALADQQLAGLLMWVPASLAYTVAALLVLAAWLRAADERARRREGVTPPPPPVEMQCRATASVPPAPRESPLAAVPGPLVLAREGDQQDA